MASKVINLRANDPREIVTAARKLPVARGVSPEVSEFAVPFDSTFARTAREQDRAV